jgi:hypothetical protein
VCSFCLSIYLFSGIPRDSQGFLGSSCRVLCVLFVCQFKVLRDSQGFLGSRCRVLCVLFVCQFTCSQGLPGIPRDSWAPAVGYCVFFLSVNLPFLRDSQGFLGSSCRVLCVLFVCQFTWSQGFPGIPGLQLSGIVCSFCLSIRLFSGIPRDSWAPAVGYCVLFFVCQFTCSQGFQGIPGLQLGSPRRLQENPREHQ